MNDKDVVCFVPQASVAKVIKRAVGESVQVGKEAKVSGTIDTSEREGGTDLTGCPSCMVAGDSNKSGGHLHPVPHRLVRQRHLRCGSSVRSYSQPSGYPRACLSTARTTSVGRDGGRPSQ